MRKKILVVYFSGAGNTKLISEIIGEQLNKKGYFAQLYNIAKKEKKINFNDFDLIVLGFPIFHANIPKIVNDFILNVNNANIKPIFLFCTYHLFLGKALFNCAKKCEKRNFKIIATSSYKAPATDGVLLFNFKKLFLFEKNIAFKIKKDIDLIDDYLSNKQIIFKKTKYSKGLNFINLVNANIGEKFENKLFKIKIDYNKCIECKWCIKNCPNKCFSFSKVIKYDNTNCEHCYHCIHHCSQKAIYLNNRKTTKQLNKNFYQSYKQKITKQL